MEKSRDPRATVLIYKKSSTPRGAVTDPRTKNPSALGAHACHAWRLFMIAKNRCTTCSHVRAEAHACFSERKNGRLRIYTSGKIISMK